MGVDPRFGDRVVVTSSTTRVDTERLVAAAARVRELATRAQAGAETVGRARERAALDAGLAPAETAWAVGLLDAAQASAASVAVQLEGMADALAFAALVYVAAEGDAAAFDAADRLLCPEAAAWWSTGWGTLHTRERARDLLPEAVQGHVPGPFLDDMAAPWHPGLIGLARSAPGHVAAAFGDGRRSDGADLMRVQLDMEALSGLLVDQTATIRLHGTPVTDQQAFAWWGRREMRTPAAASVAAGWALGVGRLVNGGATRGVQVTMAVPVDTLDIRTGRPVGYRASSVVAGSDASAGTVGVIGAAGANRLLPGVTALAAAAAAVPVPQGAAPVPVPAAPRPPAPTGTPRAPSELLERITRLEPTADHGQFEILQHRTPAGDGSVSTSWSVVIRGTHGWGVGQADPQDLLTNLQGVAGEASDQQRAVLQAMERMGIAPGEPVEIAGHSQGAIVAARLAADPAVAERYDIVSVLAAGGPTAGSAPVGEARLLALENTRDGVPGLDGAANADPPGSATVSFDGALVDNPRADVTTIGAHDLGVYGEAMSWLEDQAGASDQGGAATAEVSDWIEARSRSLGLTDDTRTTSYLFDTRRVR